jgi:carbon-monoxide dehydrogenase large subunit
LKTSGCSPGRDRLSTISPKTARCGCTVDDVAVNPMLLTGQVHGGVAQGIGRALYEGVSYDSEGQLLTASYQDYCLPRAGDIPPIEVTLDGSAPCRTNPLGAKGCGESGAIGGPPCITDGVMDALSELGIKTLIPC